ncbi:Clp protease N-terminal domain-containing protein [Streptomyces sp. NPDC020875]|uniref:Clp protease N-terminal domain-containing protein n=1 Tax=Streptomyces sp. NPDC020875 TaxID=3154898 RepID=UPI0033C0B5B2
MTRRQFDVYVETVIESGADEARRAGSPTVEAEHLLLAVATDRESAAGRLLEAAGLGRDAVHRALREEFRESLAAAGISIADEDLPRPSASAKPPSRLGQSAKLALERGLATAGGRRELHPLHLLLGILLLEFGTVPRALSLAGVDRPELRARVEASLGTEDAS